MFKPLPTFNDGVCDIYSISDEDVETVKQHNLCFSKRTLGYRRFFSAAAAQTDITRVIRVPLITNFDSKDFVRIGSDVYEVVMVQEVSDFNPPCLDFSLRQLEMHR